jgi:hypothetical protein
MGANPGTDGLVSWWSMNETDGTRSDSHTFANHLADNNSVASTAGKQANAASLVKANQEWLSVANNPSVSTGDVDYTIAGWVKLSSKAGSTPMTIVSKYGTAWPGSMEYSLQWHPAYDQFLFVMGNGVTANSVGASSAGSPQTGTWYFVVAWHNAATNEWHLGQ